MSKPTELRERLSSADRTLLLRPWRRAEGLTRCCLYWLPVNSFPIPAGQRDWILQFLERWTAFVKAETGFRAELFLQYKVIYPNLMDSFLNRMLDFIPVMGLGRKVGEAMPAHPTQQEIDDMTKSMFEALKRQEPAPPPDGNKYMPDYSYWFLDKSHKEQQQMFFGFGGITLTFLKPDPKTVPPTLAISPALQKKLPLFESVKKSMAQASSLGDGFQQKTKDSFGADLLDKPQTKGLPFILPLLNTSDFHTQTAEYVKSCFEIFPVYFRETPQEQGVLLAFQADLEPGLIQILKDMEQQKLVYPER